jgi:predicted HicB family RNase H-like nuclease
MPPGKPKIKTAVMTMRVSPQVKAAAEIAAQHERRSVTSLVEVLIINHCKALNIDLENSDPQEPTK